MWASWTEKASKSMADATKNLTEATKGISEAMEKTGGAISQVAVNTKIKAAQSSKSENEGTIVDLPPEAPDKSGSDDQNQDGKDPSTTGSEAGGCKDEDGDDTAKGGSIKPSDAPPAKVAPSAVAAANANKEKLLKNFQMGWSSVVETTKRSIESTVQIMEKEQAQFKQNFPFTHIPGNRGKFYKRDRNLPVDADALRDAEVVYVTDRIITMSHPALPSNEKPQFIPAERKLAAVGHLLQQRHDGRFLVWNLSEVDYDISILDDQVLTFSFPGSPAPPLGLLLKLLISMENWLTADERNIAVIHCLTGRGRTSTVLAAFLCWMGQAGFSNDMSQALAYIARCKQMKPNDLTIPSQRRYGSYFSSMLDNVRPSQQPLLLKRIIMSTAPKFAKGPPREDVQLKDPESAGDGDGETQVADSVDENMLMGCAPYLQIFKAGKLVFTTAATIHYQQSEQDLPFIQGIDGPVPFNVEQVVQGDILIRCRHLTFTKERVSMFRAAFHTGYVPQNVLRLTKSQLDGACVDKRFPDDFFLDLIFERFDPEASAAQTKSSGEDEQKKESVSGEEKKEPKRPVVSASSFDSMLHGDSRFWDVIAARRKEASKTTNGDPLWGPTVGHRRSDKKKDKESGKKDDNKGEDSAVERTQLETFSIGGELDFLPKEAPPPPKDDSPPKKDSLMEALMALDEDEAAASSKHQMEQIVFDTQNEKTPQPTFTETALSSEFGNDGASGKGADDENTTKSASSKSTTVAADTKESSTDAKPAETSEEDDMDALLAMSEDEDFGDVDLADYDDDDDLEDLEKMLQTS